MENKKLKFSETILSEEIKRALEENGYVEATPIQSKTLEHLLDGKDVIGQSQTGTGKTAAYGLPIINSIDKNNNKVQALILCPTRELALQVVGELRKFAKYEEGIKSLAVYGGESIEKQITALKKGVKIIVGTPGRIMDHMRRKTIKLANIKTVVLDEADEMLSMGFEEDIETILNETPAERQTVLFSATLDARIRAIAKKYLNEPVEVKIKAKELTVDKIEQIAIEVKQSMKDEALSRIIDVNNPKKAVIFCNTKRKVDDLIETLRQRGYSAESFHGDIKQIQRERIMKRFKGGEFKILIATDVVARGIDVDELNLVVNYDLPQEEEYYVHRIGRTGRNGAEGKAYTFVVGKERRKLESIEKYAHTKVSYGKIPTDSEMKEIKNKKLITEIQNVIDGNEFENNKIINDVYEKLAESNDKEKMVKALLKIAFGEQIEVEKMVFDNANKSSKEKTEKGNTRFFLSVGKKDNVKAKDILGSITSNVPISGSAIGKINVLDKFSFVEIPTQYASDVLYCMKGKQIKGKDVRVEISC